MFLSAIAGGAKAGELATGRGEQMRTYPVRTAALVIQAIIGAIGGLSVSLGWAGTNEAGDCFTGGAPQTAIISPLRFQPDPIGGALPSRDTQSEIGAHKSLRLDVAQRA